MLVDAKFLEQTRNGGEHRLDGKLLTDLIDNEIDVIRKIPSVVPSIGSTRVEVQGMEVKRSIESKIVGRELIVRRGRVPYSIRSQEYVRKRTVLDIGRRGHVNIEQARTVGSRSSFR